MDLGDVLDPAQDQGMARSGRMILKRSLERVGRFDQEMVDGYYPILLEAYREEIDTHTQFFPGAMEAVMRLKALGYPIAICTNKPEALAHLSLTRLGVLERFDALVGADTLPVRKPDPAPLIEAARRAGGDPSRCVLIGDSDTDHNTARAAGVPSVLVTFGPSGDDMAALEPEALLDRFEDLPELVGQPIGLNS